MALAIAFDRLRPLQRSRWRLTLLYAGTMGGLLLLCAIAVDVLLTRSYRFDLDHRLESVAGVLQASLEPQLSRSQSLASETQQWLRQLCPPRHACPTASHGKVTDPAAQGGYLQVLSTDGQTVMTLGVGPVSSLQPQAGWQTLSREQGHFRQLVLPLRDRQQQPWGLLVLGRSLVELDQQVQTWRWGLAIALPLLLAIISWLSWWLAGQALQPVLQSYRQMQQFTADAAHELRTPLAALQATVESHQPSEAAQVWPVLERQMTRLQLLIEDLLLLSRLDRDQPVLGDRCCLNDLVEEAAATFMPLANQAQIALQIEAVGTGLLVSGNSAQLYRVLANLLGNAIAHTPAGGKIQLALSVVDRWGVLTVRDNGCGIPTADQARIFERFVRLDSARNRQQGGAGLGLAIVQAIVRAHRGQVQVTSAIGQGSCFRVQLPLLAT
ncbi:two-component system sensor histidine kinase RppB [Synechococcus elongatus]|uniref:histidine kinase n=1 Tax=Synechococcus elongatus (strain ATCC 33912 / PCC 7942 / FACHB-805) TaxID=1140 RepID=P72560_SYNE7|nr:two-component system sensor histidine kinase RppB [Synechococcus elongatus]AAB38788.1 histidine protein kinase [Synechococcus elongatus PCC 7942 = FACHB-805]AAM81150.1 ANL22 [Synechococcus elongatus PCC 7942 = FACHB-805]ABB58675.1 two-component sensor histidine kinase [Synechococcus elongatus PCC 7942 = FACHB-805]AJD58960.1 histidine kinase [Synechococcus elongatus UTEX 2973]MBD2589051.1 HAMP domain-containing histidine kinase [Synechococcus elongatus FACHB-242]